MSAQALPRGREQLAQHRVGHIEGVDRVAVLRPRAREVARVGGDHQPTVAVGGAQRKDVGADTGGSSIAPTYIETLVHRRAYFRASVKEAVRGPYASGIPRRHSG